jgi:hypothetical protein
MQRVSTWPYSRAFVSRRSLPSLSRGGQPSSCLGLRAIRQGKRLEQGGSEVSHGPSYRHERGLGRKHGDDKGRAEVTRRRDDGLSVAAAGPALRRPPSAHALEPVAGSGLSCISDPRAPGRARWLRQMADVLSVPITQPELQLRTFSERRPKPATLSMTGSVAYP